VSNVDALYLITFLNIDTLARLMPAEKASVVVPERMGKALS
jgi:hypothetical protein